LSKLWGPPQTFENMNQNPLISVVIPALNREKSITYCLNSVLAQTYENIEVIVVDDCSTDSTVAVVKSCTDPRIRCIVLERNAGAQAARNRGIKEATGDWIAFQDSDDEWMPGRLWKTLNCAQSRKVKVVYCDGLVNRGRGHGLVKLSLRKLDGHVYSDLLIAPGPLYQGLLVKIECFEKIGYLDENILAHQEWDTSIMLAKYFEFGFVDEPLFIWHNDGHDSISSDSRKNCVGYAQIVLKHMSEIIAVTSNAVLSQHFENMALRYHSIGDYESSSIYFKEAASLSYSRLRKWTRVVQSHRRAMTLINPKYLDIFRAIKIMKRIILRID
jgi:glycosyltransferase involved in cell wall biosynthesis